MLKNYFENKQAALTACPFETVAERAFSQALDGFKQRHFRQFVQSLKASLTPEQAEALAASPPDAPLPFIPAIPEMTNLRAG
jgi:hypothetical protein